MHSRTFSCLVIVVALSAPACIAQDAAASSDDLVSRIARMSDAERVALAKSLIDEGSPVGGGLSMLARSRSSIVLPLIERKIEETSLGGKWAAVGVRYFRARSRYYPAAASATVG
jgi:hypothetical protein